MLQIDLHGQRALVTGASGELGRTIAFTLAQCGADIAIHYYQNRAKAEELQHRIEGIGRQARIFQADLRQATHLETWREQVAADFGAPHILVINAVVQYSWKPLLQQDLADYTSQLESTVMQTVALVKAFAPSMVSENQGRIIGINTECTMQCLPTQSAYVAGKRGMDGIFRVLARELGPHQITVNQVAPGWTRSDKDQAHSEDHARDYIQSVPLRRRGTDQEVANTVAFLASPLASFITGAYIPVNGGNAMPTV